MTNTEAILSTIRTMRRELASGRATTAYVATMAGDQFLMTVDSIAAIDNRLAGTVRGAYRTVMLRDIDALLCTSVEKPAVNY